MYPGGLMSPMQRCFSDLVCQPLVTSYVIDAYLSLAMYHAWTLEYQHMMLCVWRWIYLRRQKGNGQLGKTTGSPSQRIAQQGSGWCQRSTAAIYAVEIWERKGPQSGATVYSDYAMTTMMMKDVRLVSKMEVKLIFQGIYRLSGTGIVECLKIIDVGCNRRIFCRKGS